MGEADPGKFGFGPKTREHPQRNKFRDLVDDCNEKGYTYTRLLTMNFQSRTPGTFTTTHPLDLSAQVEQQLTHFRFVFKSE